MNVAMADASPARHEVSQGAASRAVRLLPPIAALVYPVLIWCSTSISPVFLAIALIVPWVGLLVVHRAGSGTRHPRSRGIALAVVGAPALFSMLGGLLDFQRVLPIHAIHVWMLLWSGCGFAAFVERPRTQTAKPAVHPRLAFAHGISALVITAFAALHLLNHLSGLWGGDTHIAIMAVLRVGYRHPLVEAALLTCVGFQMLSGIRLLPHKLAATDGWIDTLQAASGTYLAFFFGSHLSAVLRARYLRHVDTNWIWLTADSMLTDPWSARLAPYYFLGVVALGVHGGAAIRYVMRERRRSIASATRAFYATVGAAAVVAVLIMTALMRG